MNLDMIKQLKKKSKFKNTKIILFFFLEEQRKVKVTFFKIYKNVTSVLLCFWGRKEMFLFNDTFNTFYLQLYGVRHMVKGHSDITTHRNMHRHSTTVMIMLIVWWIIGSIPHEGLIELFFLLSQWSTTGVTKALVCTILSVGWYI